jgi:signal transduction histidine kinase
LNQLVKQVYLKMQSAAERRGIDLSLTLTEDAVEVAADEAGLGRAILEIVENAIQFTPEGGSVALRTLHQTGLAMVEIQDTGIGIADTDLPHIFERLYRVDKARSTTTGGVGLGLAIAQKIISLHSGNLTATSSPGEGSTFQMVLPVPPKNLDHNLFSAHMVP